MIGKNIQKLLYIVIGLFILSLTIKILYYVVDSASNLSEKGWLPPLIFITLVLLLLASISYIGFRFLLNKQQTEDEHELSNMSPEEKSASLTKKMESHNKRDNSQSLQGNIIIPVYGASFVGKTSIIDWLIKNNNASDDSKNTIIADLREMPSINDDIQNNSNILDIHKNSKLSILVISEDLTNYEWDTLYKLIYRGSYVIIALNKTDLLSQVQRGEIETAIVQKIQEIQKHNRCSLVQTAASPKAVTVIIQSQDGTEKEEDRPPRSDCSPLLRSILKSISTHSNQKEIKFTRTSR